MSPTRKGATPDRGCYPVVNVDPLAVPREYVGRCNAGDFTGEPRPDHDTAMADVVAHVEASKRLLE